VKWIFVFLGYVIFLVQTASGAPGCEGNRMCRMEVVSGHEQYAREGKTFRDPLAVRCMDSLQQPVEGVLVRFTPENSDMEKALAFPEMATVVTDSAGMAYLSLGEAYKKGDYAFVVSVPSQGQLAPELCMVHVRDAHWVFFLISGLLGGLGLFLLGMGMMSEGMQNSAGERMRTVLAKLTHNRFVALSLGALITMVIQSSSATNVMLVSFVNSRLMRFRQTIGVMLGAAIGTTITAQIIAFKLTDYSLLFIALGLSVQYFMPKMAAKELGKALLGFGILFFGMHIMSESMYPLRSYEPFLKAITNLQNPALGILVGALLTALIQSSSAFIGILIILSMQGLLSLNVAIPLLIGANVGTSITAILAALKGSREAKQVALSHTVFKIIGAILVLALLPWFYKLIFHVSALSDTSNMLHSVATPRQIANAHTVYNLILCGIFLPFTNAYARFIQWMFPYREEPEKAFTLRYINEGLLITPAFALDGARLELVRMMKKVYFMTEKILHPFLDKNPAALKGMERSEEEINYLRDQMVDYLLKLSQNDIAPELAEEAFILMNAIREFEQIADVVSGQLYDKANRWCANNYEFSDEGRAELKAYHENTLKILIQALKVYETNDPAAARKLKSRYKRFRDDFFEFERLHYLRLREHDEQSQSSSKTHLEIITLLRVISNHATTTSRILIYRRTGGRKRKNE